MKKLYVLISALLFGCADSDRYGTSRYCCPDLVPVYKVGEIREFVSMTGNIKKMKVISNKDTTYYKNNDPEILHRVDFERLNDNRKFLYLMGNALVFQDTRLFVNWENCPFGIDIKSLRDYTNSLVVNGKNYTSCVSMSGIGGDEASHLKVIYDIKEGIVSYTDSSGTRWDLVPK